MKGKQTNKNMSRKRSQFKQAKLDHAIEKAKKAGREAARNGEPRNAWAADVVQEFAKNNPKVGSGSADVMEAWFYGYDSETSDQMIQSLNEIA